MFPAEPLKYRVPGPVFASEPVPLTAPETVAKFGSRGMLAGSPFVLYGLLRYLHLVYTRGSGGSPTEVVVTDPGVIAAVLGPELAKQSKDLLETTSPAPT